ncbi:MAG: hypothetical protein AAF602_23885 [Myxococcota bacterium]
MKHVLLIASVLTGCAHPTAAPLPPAAQAALTERIDQLDAEAVPIYTGRVQPRGDDADALFSYRRFVSGDGEEQVSSHLTVDADDEPRVLHVAHTASDGRLLRFDEWHGQTGLVGSMVVDASHTATIEVTVGGERTERTEEGDAPVHTGPSLFGFVLQHWDALVDGEVRPLRFAVLADARTYRFDLRLASIDEVEAVFEMRASSAFVRLAVPTLAITFDPETRAPIRYEGLVPPLRETPRGLRPLDARVDYVLDGPDYR